MSCRLPALTLVLAIFSASIACAQPKNRVPQLTSLIKNAGTDSLKVLYLGELADHYYTYKLDLLGDSVLKQQLFTAENNRNKNLILSVLFSNVLNNINRWSSTETFERALKFIQKGLDFAKSIDREDYIALGHARLAELYRKKGDLENAFLHANMGIATAQNIVGDSIRAVATIQLADVYLDQHQSLVAFKTYNNAYELALKDKNDNLLSAIYTKLSNLYKALGNNEIAKEYLFKSLDLHIFHNNVNGQIEDYLALVNLTDQKEYLDKATLLLKRTQSEKHKLMVHRLTFAYKILYTTPNEALDYFNATESLRSSYSNQGKHYVNWKIAEIYTFGTPPNFDSALHYYQLAEPHFETNVNASTQEDFFSGLANVYEINGYVDSAIARYQQTLRLSETLKNLDRMVGVNDKLSSLYRQKNDYKRAFEYAEQSRFLKDSMQLLNKERDVVLLEVDRENKKIAADQEQQRRDLLKKRNLQYMAITIAIAAFFLFLIVIGMFPVSKFTINMLSFFAFICLFEFIVLLIDSYLHKVTHGEPLKIWLVKIFLIALLVPCQHFLEHAMTHFLASEKLVLIRKHINLKRWGRRQKKATPLEVADSDITVL